MHKSPGTTRSGHYRIQATQSSPCVLRTCGNGRSGRLYPAHKTLYNWSLSRTFFSLFKIHINQICMSEVISKQTGMGRSVAPLSQDKDIFLSRCPFVPGRGQEQTSRDKLLCPGTSQDKMNFYLSNCTKNILEKMTRIPVLESPFLVLEHPFLF